MNFVQPTSMGQKLDMQCFVLYVDRTTTTTTTTTIIIIIITVIIIIFRSEIAHDLYSTAIRSDASSSYA